MITRAVLRYVRITPRKFRLIIPLVKGKRPEDAIAILTGVKKGASKYGIDVISSALNNAKRKQGVDVSELCISNFVANGGPMLKRFRAASMGRASSIHKHTSHLTVELDVVKTETPAHHAEDKAAKKLKVEKVKTVHAPKKEAKEKEAAHKDKKIKMHKK